VLVHRHVHSTDLLSHCIAQESHLEFLINSSTQRRLIHHLYLCSHDDAPNTLGFHTFTLCSTTGMSNSANLLSHCVTQENHLEFFSTLCKEEAISTLQLHRQRFPFWPVWGNGLGHSFFLAVTLSSGQVEWSASPGSHSFEVHSCEQFRRMVCFGGWCRTIISLGNGSDSHSLGKTHSLQVAL
jgi:hypothetical protein